MAYTAHPQITINNYLNGERWRKWWYSLKCLGYPINLRTLVSILYTQLFLIVVYGRFAISLAGFWHVGIQWEKLQVGGATLPWLPPLEEHPGGTCTLYIQKNYGTSPFYSWLNPLFPWPFSIANRECLPGRVALTAAQRAAAPVALPHESRGMMARTRAGIIGPFSLCGWWQKYPLVISTLW
jgi:hypothetical protein